MRIFTYSIFVLHGTSRAKDIQEKFGFAIWIWSLTGFEKFGSSYAGISYYKGKYSSPFFFFFPPFFLPLPFAICFSKKIITFQIYLKFKAV